MTPDPRTGRAPTLAQTARRNGRAIRRSRTPRLSGSLPAPASLRAICGALVALGIKRHRGALAEQRDRGMHRADRLEIDGEIRAPERADVGTFSPRRLLLDAQLRHARARRNAERNIEGETRSGLLGAVRAFVRERGDLQQASAAPARRRSCSEDAAPPRARSPRPEGLPAAAPAEWSAPADAAAARSHVAATATARLSARAAFPARYSGSAPCSFATQLVSASFRFVSAVFRSTPPGCAGCSVSGSPAMPERITAALISGAVTGALVSTRKPKSCAAAARTGCGTSGRVSAASTSAISGAKPFCFATASRTMAVTAACSACFGARRDFGQHQLHGRRQRLAAFGNGRPRRARHCRQQDCPMPDLPDWSMRSEPLADSQTTTKPATASAKSSAARPCLQRRSARAFRPAKPDRPSRPAPRRPEAAAATSSRRAIARPWPASPRPAAARASRPACRRRQAMFAER